MERCKKYLFENIKASIASINQGIWMEIAFLQKNILNDLEKNWKKLNILPLSLENCCNILSWH
jgi:hypothetical protein